MTNDYDPTRTYCVGDTAPTNPIVATKDMFIIISDVRDEGLTEEKEQVWSYKKDRVISVADYIKEYLIQ